MPLYDIFFFSALFFLCGILFASLGLKLAILAIVILCVIVFLILKLRSKDSRFLWLASLLVFIPPGALYYHFDNLRFHNSSHVEFDKKIVFSGIISKNPSIGEGGQSFVLKLDDPFSGNILVKTSLYPRFHYGERIRAESTIQGPFPEGYARYLEKERIRGIVSFPNLEVISEHNLSRLKETLFAFRERITNTFLRVLPPKEAGFLVGLTLGGSTALPKEFKDAMSASGTTHLVALSGYNITVIIWAAMGFFSIFFRKNVSFFLSTILIILFVLMAGAEASVVRAAIMAFLVMLGTHLGRIYDARNAIIFAGLLMVLHNPKVLVFDVGFQLSFLALLGILYLKPAIEKILEIPKSKNFLSLREQFLTTISAQAMVLPILISNFGSFSVTSIVANVLILGIVPYVMALGFSVAILSFFSYYTGLVVSWFLEPFLKYQIIIIELFAKLRIGISLSFNFFWVFVYYGCIVIFIAYVQRFFGGYRKT